MSAPALDHRGLGLGIATNYAVIGAQAAFLLVTTPVVIAGAGAEAFGVWTLVLAVRAYLGLLELTLGPASARFVAAATSDPDRRGAITAAGSALIAGGVIAGAAGLLAAAVLPSLVEGASGLGGALIVLAAATTLQMPLNVFAHGLFGLQRIWERNAFIAARFLLAGISLTVVVEAGGGVVSFVAGVVGAELVVMSCQAVYCLARIPELRPHPNVAPGGRRALFSFGAPLLALAAARQITFATGPLVVGAALGGGAVALYGVALRVSEGLSQLVAAFAEVFMPVFARLEGSGARSRARGVFTGATLATIVVTYSFLSTAVGLGEPLIELWVGEEFGDAWPALALLCGALAVTMPILLPMAWAIGAGEHRRVAVLALCGAVMSALLGILLVGPFDVEGPALGVLLGLALFDLWPIPFVICRAIGLPLWATYQRPLATALLIVAPLAVLERALLAPALEDSPVALVAVAVVATVAAGALVGLALKPWRAQLWEARSARDAHARA